MEKRYPEKPKAISVKKKGSSEKRKVERAKVKVICCYVVVIIPGHVYKNLCLRHSGDKSASTYSASEKICSYQYSKFKSSSALREGKETQYTA